MAARKLTKVPSGVIYCENFYWPAHYGFCPSEKAWASEMRSIGQAGLPYPKSIGCCRTFERGNTILCIVTIEDGIESRATPTEVASVLVHEAVHVWQQISDHIGEKHPGSEQEAYAVQMISCQLLNAYERARGPLFQAPLPRKNKRGRRNA